MTLYVTLTKKDIPNSLKVLESKEYSTKKELISLQAELDTLSKRTNNLVTSIMDFISEKCLTDPVVKVTETPARIVKRKGIMRLFGVDKRIPRGSSTRVVPMTDRLLKTRVSNFLRPLLAMSDVPFDEWMLRVSIAKDASVDAGRITRNGSAITLRGFNGGFKISLNLPVSLKQQNLEWELEHLRNKVTTITALIDKMVDAKHTGRDILIPVDEYKQMQELIK